MSPASNVFITYNDPADLKSRQNRRAVSSFASKSYRPTSKKIVLVRNHYRAFVRRPDVESPSPIDSKSTKQKPTPIEKTRSTVANSDQDPSVQGVRPRNDCALGSPMADPFSTYPITHRSYVPFLVDYCESSRLVASTATFLHTQLLFSN